MKDCLTTLVALAIAIIFLIGIAFICYLSLPFLPEVPPTPDPLNIYEAAYERCRARETLSEEQCHDAALREAYPAKGD